MLLQSYQLFYGTLELFSTTLKSWKMKSKSLPRPCFLKSLDQKLQIFYLFSLMAHTRALIRQVLFIVAKSRRQHRKRIILYIFTQDFVVSQPIFIKIGMAKALALLGGFRFFRPDWTLSKNGNYIIFSFKVGEANRQVFMGCHIEKSRSAKYM